MRLGIELLVFSGRENPRWSVDNARLFEDLLANVGGERVETAPMSKLGYDGFRVTTEDGQEFHVRHSILTHREQHWRLCNTVEATLLALARERGFGSTLQGVGGTGV